MVNLNSKTKDKLLEKIHTEAFVEAVKEVGRYLIFALISFGLAKLAKLPQNETVVIGTALLKYLDKFLHHKWKLECRLENKDLGAKFFKGIVPF